MRCKRKSQGGPRLHSTLDSRTAVHPGGSSKFSISTNACVKKKAAVQWASKTWHSECTVANLAVRLSEMLTLCIRLQVADCFIGDVHRGSLTCKAWICLKAYYQYRQVLPALLQSQPSTQASIKAWLYALGGIWIARRNTWLCKSSGVACFAVSGLLFSQLVAEVFVLAGLTVTLQEKCGEDGGTCW